MPFRGLWIPGAGFQSFSVERGFWIPCLSGILEYFSSILDSKALGSGYHEQNFPGFCILQAKNFPDSRIRIPLDGAKY